MKKRIFTILISALVFLSPKPAKADLFGGDGVPRMAQV